HRPLTDHPGAAPEGGDRHLVGDLAGEVGRHTFDHDRERTGLFDRVGVLHDPLTAAGLETFGAPLHLVAAHAVVALRRQPDVTDDGDVDAGDGVDRGGHVDAAFELHALGTLLHQAHG